MTNLLYLLLVVGLIVLEITRFKLHPFLALLGAAMLTGFLGGLGSAEIVSTITEGFGGTLRSIGIVIGAGSSSIIRFLVLQFVLIPLPFDPFRQPAVIT